MRSRTSGGKGFEGLAPSALDILQEDIGAVDAGSFIDDVTAPRYAAVVARLQDAGSIYVASRIDAGHVNQENAGGRVVRYGYRIGQGDREMLQRIVPGKWRGHQ